MKNWAREDVAAWQLLSVRLPGNPNNNTPEGVARPELDSSPGEDTDSNTNAPAHSEGAGPDLWMDVEEDHSLEVEEEGTAGENASVGQDMGPRVELQHPGFSPLATQEEVGLLTPPSSPSPPTPEAASTQHSLVVNTGTSATPDSDSDNEAEEAFRTEMSGAEDEDAFGRAGLNGQLVKEGEEWMPTSVAGG